MELRVMQHWRKFTEKDMLNDNGMTRGYERHERMNPCEVLATDLEIMCRMNGIRIISRRLDKISRL